MIPAGEILLVVFLSVIWIIIGDRFVVVYFLLRRLRQWTRREILLVCVYYCIFICVKYKIVTSV